MLRTHSTFTHIKAVGLALTLALCGAVACDKDEGKSDKKAEAKAEESEMAKDAKQAVEEIKAELEKGEDVKYSCAGNLGMYGDLAKSEDEAEKTAFVELQKICYVDAPRKMIADLKAKIEKGELDTFDTVDLETTIEADDFPKDGEFAKVTEEATKLLEIDIPVYTLGQAHEKAKKEKEEGETVSMGCIEGEQVLEKSGEKLSADTEAKKAVDAFRETCPAEEEDAG